MKALITALIIALATVPGLLVLMAPVSAQFKPMAKPVSKEREAAEEYAKKKGRDDSGYKSAIERLPDKKFDPWANMR
jgi:hypothetical protein